MTKNRWWVGADVSGGIRGYVTEVAVVGVFVFLGGGCQGPNPFFRNGPKAITCTINRSECAAEDFFNGAPRCISRTVVPSFPATTCYDPATDGAMKDKCAADFCSTRQSRDGFDSTTCSIDNAVLANLTPGAPPVPQGMGTCTVEGGASRLAIVTYTTRFRSCQLDANGVTCDSLAVVPGPQVQQCLDVSQTPLNKQLSPARSTFDQDSTFNIISINLDDPACNPVGAGLEASEIVYGVTPGSIGTASGGGVNTPIVATGGAIGVKQSCTDDGCQLVSLDELQINVANMTVAGAQISNVVIKNTVAAPITQLLNPDNPGPGVASNSLTLFVEGYLNGVHSFFVAHNSSGLRLTATSTGFNLVGSLSITGADATGHALPLTISASVSGTPATGQALACASESGLQRLFGFEDVLSWSSSQATLSPVTSPVTQGCGALGISGQAYIPITGSTFGTSGLTVTPALSVDLFIPGNQPNQNWLGALQMYLTCPSGNVFNQYIGQVDLTGKPQNHYSTLRYPIPAAVTGTLVRPLSDCFFGLALNVNQTGQTWILDNLRFTQ